MSIKSEHKRPSVMGKTDRPSRSKIGLSLSFPKPKKIKGGGPNACVNLMQEDSEQFLAKLDLIVRCLN